MVMSFLGRGTLHIRLTRQLGNTYMYYPEVYLGRNTEEECTFLGNELCKKQFLMACRKGRSEKLEL